MACDTMGVTKAVFQPQIIVLTETSRAGKANYCPSHNAVVQENQPGWLVPQDTVPSKGSGLASGLENWALSSSGQIKHDDRGLCFCSQVLPLLLFPDPLGNGGWAVSVSTEMAREGGSLTTKAQVILAIPSISFPRRGNPLGDSCLGFK